MLTLRGSITRITSHAKGHSFEYSSSPLFGPKIDLSKRDLNDLKMNKVGIKKVLIRATI